MAFVSGSSSCLVHQEPVVLVVSGSELLLVESPNSPSSSGDVSVREAILQKIQLPSVSSSLQPLPQMQLLPLPSGGIAVVTGLSQAPLIVHCNAREKIGLSALLLGRQKQDDSSQIRLVKNSQLGGGRLLPAERSAQPAQDDGISGSSYFSLSSSVPPSEADAAMWEEDRRVQSLVRFFHDHAMNLHKEAFDWFMERCIVGGGGAEEVEASTLALCIQLAQCGLYSVGSTLRSVRSGLVFQTEGNLDFKHLLSDPEAELARFPFAPPTLQHGHMSSLAEACANEVLAELPKAMAGARKEDQHKPVLAASCRQTTAVATLCPLLGGSSVTCRVYLHAPFVSTEPDEDSLSKMHLWFSFPVPPPSQSTSEGLVVDLALSCLPSITAFEMELNRRGEKCVVEPGMGEDDLVFLLPVGGTASPPPTTTAAAGGKLGRIISRASDNTYLVQPGAAATAPIGTAVDSRPPPRNGLPATSLATACAANLPVYYPASHLLPVTEKRELGDDVHYAMVVLVSSAGLASMHERYWDANNSAWRVHKVLAWEHAGLQQAWFYSPTSALLATSDGQVFVWENVARMGGGGQLASSPTAWLSGFDNTCGGTATSGTSRFTFARSGRWLGIARGREVRVFDLEGGDAANAPCVLSEVMADSSDDVIVSSLLIESTWAVVAGDDNNEEEHESALVRVLMVPNGDNQQHDGGALRVLELRPKQKHHQPRGAPARIRLQDIVASTQWSPMRFAARRRQEGGSASPEWLESNKAGELHLPGNGGEEQDEEEWEFAPTLTLMRGRRHPKSAVFGQVQLSFLASSSSGSSVGGQFVELDSDQRVLVPASPSWLTIDLKRPANALRIKVPKNTALAVRLAGRALCQDETALRALSEDEVWEMIWRQVTAAAAAAADDDDDDLAEREAALVLLNSRFDKHNHHGSSSSSLSRDTLMKFIQVQFVDASSSSQNASLAAAVQFLCSLAGSAVAGGGGGDAVVECVMNTLVDKKNDARFASKRGLQALLAAAHEMMLANRDGPMAAHAAMDVLVHTSTSLARAQSWKSRALRDTFGCQFDPFVDELPGSAYASSSSSTGVRTARDDASMVDVSAVDPHKRLLIRVHSFSPHSRTALVTKLSSLPALSLTDEATAAATTAASSLPPTTSVEICFEDVLKPNTTHAIVWDLTTLRQLTWLDLDIQLSGEGESPYGGEGDGDNNSAKFVCTVETFLVSPATWTGDKMAYPAVDRAGLPFDIDLYTLTGTFSFDRSAATGGGSGGVIGMKSSFPTIAPRGVSITSGQYYYEVTVLSVTDGVAQIGFCDSVCVVDDKQATGCGDCAHSWAVDGTRVQKWHRTNSPWGAAWSNGDVVGCAIDLDRGCVYFSLNGNWRNPMGLAFTDVRPTGGVFPAVTGERAFKCRINFGQEPFAHQPPVLAAAAGGGTGFRSVFDWILDARERTTTTGGGCSLLNKGEEEEIGMWTRQAFQGPTAHLQCTTPTLARYLRFSFAHVPSSAAAPPGDDAQRKRVTAKIVVGLRGKAPPPSPLLVAVASPHEVRQLRAKQLALRRNLETALDRFLQYNQALVPALQWTLKDTLRVSSSSSTTTTAATTTSSTSGNNTNQALPSTVGKSKSPTSSSSPLLLTVLDASCNELPNQYAMQVIQLLDALDVVRKQLATSGGGGGGAGGDQLDTRLDQWRTIAQSACGGSGWVGAAAAQPHLPVSVLAGLVRDLYIDQVAFNRLTAGDAIRRLMMGGSSSTDQQKLGLEVVLHLAQTGAFDSCGGGDDDAEEVLRVVLPHELDANVLWAAPRILHELLSRSAGLLPLCCKLLSRAVVAQDDDDDSSGAPHIGELVDQVLMTLEPTITTNHDDAAAAEGSSVLPWALACLQSLRDLAPSRAAFVSNLCRDARFVRLFRELTSSSIGAGSVAWCAESALVLDLVDGHGTLALMGEEKEQEQVEDDDNADPFLRLAELLARPEHEVTVQDCQKIISRVFAPLSPSATSRHVDDDDAVVEEDEEDEEEVSLEMARNWALALRLLLRQFRHLGDKMDDHHPVTAVFTPQHLERCMYARSGDGKMIGVYYTELHAWLKAVGPQLEYVHVLATMDLSSVGGGGGGNHLYNLTLCDSLVRDARLPQEEDVVSSVMAAAAWDEEMLRWTDKACAALARIAPYYAAAGGGGDDNKHKSRKKSSSSKQPTSQYQYRRLVCGAVTVCVNYLIAHATRLVDRISSAAYLAMCVWLDVDRRKPPRPAAAVGGAASSSDEDAETRKDDKHWRKVTSLMFQLFCAAANSRALVGTVAQSVVGRQLFTAAPPPPSAAAAASSMLNQFAHHLVKLQNEDTAKFACDQLLQFPRSVAVRLAPRPLPPPSTEDAELEFAFQQRGGTLLPVSAAVGGDAQVLTLRLAQLSVVSKIQLQWSPASAPPVVLGTVCRVSVGLTEDTCVTSGKMEDDGTATASVSVAPLPCQFVRLELSASSSSSKTTAVSSLSQPAATSGGGWLWPGDRVTKKTGGEGDGDGVATVGVVVEFDGSKATVQWRRQVVATAAAMVDEYMDGGEATRHARGELALFHRSQTKSSSSSQPPPQMTKSLASVLVYGRAVPSRSSSSSTTAAAAAAASFTPRPAVIDLLLAYCTRFPEPCGQHLLQQRKEDGVSSASTLQRALFPIDSSSKRHLVMCLVSADAGGGGFTTEVFDYCLARVERPQCLSLAVELALGLAAPPSLFFATARTALRKVAEEEGGELRAPVSLVWLVQSWAFIIDNGGGGGKEEEEAEDFALVWRALAQCVPESALETALAQLACALARQFPSSIAVLAVAANDARPRRLVLLATTSNDMLQHLLPSIEQHTATPTSSSSSQHDWFSLFRILARERGVVFSQWFLESGWLDRALLLLELAGRGDSADLLLDKRLVLDVITLVCNQSPACQQLVAGRLFDQADGSGGATLDYDLLAQCSRFDNFVQIRVVDVDEEVDQLTRMAPNPDDFTWLAAQSKASAAAAAQSKARGSSWFRLSAQACSKAIELSRSGLVASHSSYEKWSTVRGDRELASAGQSVWEVKLDNCPKGHIFIGLASDKVNLDGYLGCDKQSYGFIGNRGLWHNRHKEATYGKEFKSGDVVKVVVDMTVGTLAYCLNGENLGVAFTGLQGQRLYPAFSLYQKGAKLTVLFSTHLAPPTVAAASSVVSSMAAMATTTATTAATTTTAARDKSAAGSPFAMDGYGDTFEDPFAEVWRRRATTTPTSAMHSRALGHVFWVKSDVVTLGQAMHAIGRGCVLDAMQRRRRRQQSNSSNHEDGDGGGGDGDEYSWTIRLTNTGGWDAADESDLTLSQFVQKHQLDALECVVVVATAPMASNDEEEEEEEERQY